MTESRPYNIGLDNTRGKRQPRECQPGRCANEMNDSFTIESGGFELLPKVEDLWYELKAHHEKIDPEFPDMSTPTFEKRKEGFREKGKEILVEWVQSKKGESSVGYCISILDKNDFGEIESLYVRVTFRGNGIGKELMERALLWLEQKKAKAVRLSVLSGNKEAIDFYSSFGFKPRVQELMIPTQKT